MSRAVLVKKERESPRDLRMAGVSRELGAEELRFAVTLEDAFTTTEELSPGQDFAGQERALAALELSVGVKRGGFNIFVSGLTGIEKLHALSRWLGKRASASPTPGDRVYVHNFHDADQPRAILLQPGQGGRLKQMMANLVRTLREDLPKAFRQEAFDKEKGLLREKYTSQAQELNARFEALAREKGFVVQGGPGGHAVFIPVSNGKPLQEPEDFARLSETAQQAVERRQQELMAEVAQLANRQREIMRRMEEDIREVERRFCDKLLAPLLAAIRSEIANEKVDAYLAEVREHILDHLDNFKEATAAPMPFAFMGLSRETSRDEFLEYDVNVMVDNSVTSGAPVVVETSPTYLNLFGMIERVVDRFGRVVTNFTRIKSGSVLRAHGGYLILNLEDALTEPAVWKVLKRTLKSGRIEMETYEPFALFSASGLKPEPIAIDTKLIVVGSPLLYHLLYLWDEEFRDVFKVHADFRPVMEREPSHVRLYAQWVGRVCREEGLPHFDRGAVERIVLFGAREAGDREKMLASYDEIADLVREAAYWARKEDCQLVSRSHVEKALEGRVFRSNRIEEEIRELIANGTLVVEIDGQKVGQVNGLSVLNVGRYTFGRPSRVTASVALGQAGIINIERESRLSGSIHDKGVLILSGYLRNRYGQDKPLALSASLCFEQSYSGVEGDSASSAELCALLSRLSNIPLRQDIAVTGSVDQWGGMQAIGGVNEKVEGFFEVCRAKGLTGRQGVIIPAANVRNLILQPDVVAAVAEGRFHIYPVRMVDEGIEILTGVRAGEVGEEGTVNQVVSARLKEMAVEMRGFAAGRESPAESAGEAKQ